MPQVITYQHSDHTFFVMNSLRDALNEALEAKELPKCEMSPYEYKDGFLGKISTQPDEGKVYVPGNYTSEDFLALFEQQDPRGYIKGNEAQSETKEEQKDSEEKTEVKVETPIQKAEKQLARVVAKLADVKFVAKDRESNLTTEVEKIKASFESQIQAFQNLITEKFLEDSKLLDKLGKDLPAEDIDKIYFVHGDNPSINSKLSERRKEVVEFLSTRSKTSNEYKLALNFRIAKYKTEVAKFIRSYVNAHIRLIARQNDVAINEPVVTVRTSIDNSSQYKAEMEKVLRLKADRASEKLEKQRKREKARAMTQTTKAGIVAVLDNCVVEARAKLNKQFDNAVVVTQSQMKKLSEKNPDFDPRTNVEDYKLLVKNVLHILNTDPDFKIEPIGVGSDSKTDDQIVLDEVSQKAGVTMTPEALATMQQMISNLTNKSAASRNAAGNIPEKVEV